MSDARQKTKFSKATVIEIINARIDNLQRKHKFDERNGWAQVEDAETAKIVDYGRFDELHDLLDQLTSA